MKGHIEALWDARRVALSFLVVGIGVMLAVATLGLAPFGDVDAPAATHVSNYYIENSNRDAHTPNIVTVMIADYRSFDTLGETLVIFTAGLACLFILRSGRESAKPIGTGFFAREGSLIVNVVTRVMVPLVQIFALYVIFHGHYSPGGGFQGGALLAGSVLLQRVVVGRRRSQQGFASHLATKLGSVGFLIYFGTGLVALLCGGSFLQYDALPLPLDAVMRRNTGILFVELGVALVVLSTLVSIFDTLAEGDER